MKGLEIMKDKWYTINDIILALIIITVAAIIIFWRFDILMQYPDHLAKNNAKRQTEMDKKDETNSSKSSAIKMGKAFKDGQLIDNVNITILEGNDEAAFKDLIDKNLFDNYAQFEDALKSLNLSVDMVRRGTMGFNKGTSVETLLKDLTS